MGGSTSLDFSDTGVTGGTDANIRSKGGFFSSDKNWTEHVDLTDEAKAAAQDIFDALKAGNDSFAKAVGAEAGQLVTASFVQEVRTRTAS